MKTIKFLKIKYLRQDSCRTQTNLETMFQSILYATGGPLRPFWDGNPSTTRGTVPPGSMESLATAGASSRSSDGISESTATNSEWESAAGSEIIFGCSASV